MRPLALETVPAATHQEGRISDAVGKVCGQNAETCRETSTQYHSKTKAAKPPVRNKKHVAAQECNMFFRMLHFKNARFLEEKYVSVCNQCLQYVDYSEVSSHSPNEVIMVH